MPSYEILFSHSIDPGEPLAVGDAFRWGGEEVWRVESIDEAGRVIARLWPTEEPYPGRIKGTSSPSR